MKTKTRYVTENDIHQLEKARQKGRFEFDIAVRELIDKVNQRREGDQGTDDN